MTDIDIAGVRGKIVVRRWDPADPPLFVAVLVHGYGEHAGRYGHVATALNEAGAVVYAPDHHGHGRSGGDRALVDDVDRLAADVAKVVELANREYDELPVVLIGHSLGGMIATRYVQKQHARIAALVLSAPVLGGNPELLALAELDPALEVPLDPKTLSRDPKVGEAYAADPLVFHGPFHKQTLKELTATVARIAKDPGFGDLPTLWIHGEKDALAPYAVTKKAMAHLRGTIFEEKVYKGAMHEIFNETNQTDVIADVVEFLHRNVHAS